MATKSNGNQAKGKKGIGSTVRSTLKKNTDDIRSGQAVSLEFFKRNAWVIIVIMTALVAVMGLRYRTKARMAEIKQLNKELQRAESFKLQEKAQYMTLIRETELTRLTAEKNLSLRYQEEPPVMIECPGIDTPDN
ncbi:MAG: FtsL-like putative cell division protein [Bacteroidales bacterium]|nr:FtsL-like putative cell division protein [Bacteroidales bacterium]